MTIRSFTHSLHDYLPYELIDSELITERTQAPVSDELQADTRQQHPHRDDVRDYWITLATAIVLGTISLFFLSSAIVKFGQALSLTTQSQGEVPENVTRQALSHIK